MRDVDALLRLMHLLELFRISSAAYLGGWNKVDDFLTRMHNARLDANNG